MVKNTEPENTPIYSGMNIYERINHVRADVSYVQKDKKITSKGGGGYAVVTHDALTAASRESLIDWGVVQIPTVHDVKLVDPAGKIVLVNMLLTFHCVDQPKDAFSVVYASLGVDYGDKAIGKAVSLAVKTAMLKVLNLETGENEESRVELTSQAPVEEEKAYWVIDALEKLGTTEDAFVGWYNGRHGPTYGDITNPADIPKKAYPQVRTQIKIWQEKKAGEK